MSQNNFIYWREDVPQKNGLTFANVHLLVGYNPGAIADFQRMAAELKETFPQATDYEIHCGKVQTSRVYKGHSIISWNAYIPAGDYPGWQQFKNTDIEYGW